MKERDYFYLKGTEELGELIEIIRDFQGQEIVLVVPVGAKALLHPVNVELLKKETDKIRKKILFNTEDAKLSELLRAAGFQVFLEEYDDAQTLQKVVTDIIVPARVKPKTQKSKATVEAFRTEGRKRIRLPFLKYLIVGVGLTLLILAAVFGVAQFASKATVTIYLKAVKNDLNQIIELRSAVVADDVQKQILKGEKIDLTKTHTLTVPASGEGKGSGRAKGTITIYNSSNQSLSLVAGTRFQSPEGKIYRSTKRIYIPASSEERKVDFEVVAEEGGEKYNVSAKAEFKIPGLVATVWTDRLRAVAEDGISGGSSGDIKVVSLDDLVQGRTALEKEIEAILTNELKLRYPKYLFPEELGVLNIKLADISHKVGQPADRISFSGVGELKTIGVEKDRLINFLKDLAAKDSLKQQNNIRITDLNITGFKIIDLDPKLQYLRAEVSGTVGMKGDIDLRSVTNQLAGKTLKDVKKILAQNSSIENAEASIWPFWSETLPTDPDQIEVKVK